MRLCIMKANKTVKANNVSMYYETNKTVKANNVIMYYES